MTDQGETATRRLFEKYRKENKDIIVTGHSRDPGVDEWQCTECGHVSEGKRPGYCPDCNCVDGDRPMGIRLFIPRDACGWFE